MLWCSLHGLLFTCRHCIMHQGLQAQPLIFSLPRGTLASAISGFHCCQGRTPAVLAHRRMAWSPLPAAAVLQRKHRAGTPSNSFTWWR